MYTKTSNQVHIHEDYLHVNRKIQPQGLENTWIENIWHTQKTYKNATSKRTHNMYNVHVDVYVYVC